MEAVIENGKESKSISAFAKTYNFKEESFYNHFSNLKELEQAVYKAFFDHTYAMIVQSMEYQDFSARNKLLSFYYTFFELLSANRTFIIKNLKTSKRTLKSIKVLKELRKAFTIYISTLNIETFTLHEQTLDNLQSKFLEKAAWLQLLFLIKFWIDDTSPNFEKTDILIEKSVNTSFELINIQPLKSAIDLGKFLFNEKIKK